MIDSTLLVPATSITVEGPPVPKLKLDLGCGERPADGFQGVDQCVLKEGVIKHDLFTFPWPFEADSVDEVRCSHFLEHIPGKLRLLWFGELWRVMKVGAQAQFIFPSADSNRAVQDPTHMWPPIVPEFFSYLSMAWRKANGLTHGDYETTAHFSVVSLGVAYHPDVAAKADEARAFSAAHYRNATIDTYVVIKKEEVK